MRTRPHHIEDAFETIGSPTTGPVVFTCEHASNRVPSPLTTAPAEEALLRSHWGWDIGMRQMTMEAAAQTRSVAVLARFSRLVCDANRHRDSPTLILPAVEQTPLSFNQHLDEAEVARRQEHYHEPYHQAIDDALTERLHHPGPLLLLSMHSFTPVWQHQLRPMDVGVLFGEHHALAEELAAHLRSEGLYTALNAPYSGANGLMYAADRHSAAHQVPCLELELNQTLTSTPARVAALTPKIVRAVMALGLLASR